MSASLEIGAFDELASSTNSIICANVVSAPTFVALNLKYPVLLVVAAITLSPIFFSTGILSPVNAAWSIEVDPSIITPSTGMFCPGLTTTISSTITSSTETSISFPSRITVAVFGARSSILEIASDVLPFDLASKYLPMVINAKIIPADSKYKS